MEHVPSLFGSGRNPKASADVDLRIHDFLTMLRPCRDHAKIDLKPGREYTGDMDALSPSPMSGLLDAQTPQILGSDMSPVLEGDDVAKKRVVKPAPKTASSQPNAITIRGSTDWKTWLEEFAGRMRSRPTAIIDLALAKLAHQEGFREPPPRI